MTYLGMSDLFFFFESDRTVLVQKEYKKKCIPVH